MPAWLKTVWVIAIVISSSAIIWFLFGVTANFQRSVDLVGRITFIIFWFPSVILVLLSVWILYKKWAPPAGIGYVIVGFIIVLQLILSVPLFEGVRTDGWIHENVQTDPYKLTSDKKFEYRLEIVNFRQKATYERLRIKNISTGEEKIIKLQIGTNQSDGLTRGRDTWAWAVMNPTTTPGQYELSTTEYLNIPKKTFLIDFETGTSRINN